MEEKRTCYICGKPMGDCYDKDLSKNRYVHPNCMKIKRKSKLDIGDVVSYKFRKRDYPNEPIIFGKVRHIYESTFAGKIKDIAVSMIIINPENHPTHRQTTTFRLSKLTKVNKVMLTPEEAKKRDADKAKHPEKYCCICKERIGVCNHTGAERNAYRIAKPFFDEEKKKLKEKLIKLIEVEII